MNGRDPGWKPVMKLLGRALLPWNMLRRRAPSRELTKLIQIRLIWLNLIVPHFSFFVVLSFIMPWDGDGGLFVWAIIAAGVISIATVLFLKRLPLNASSPEALLGSFTQRFFVSFAFSEITVLFGFVCAFLRDVRWLYLLGLPFGQAGLVVSGPLRTNIEHYDRILRATGTPLRLSSLLMESLTPER